MLIPDYTGSTVDSSDLSKLLPNSEINEKNIPMHLKINQTMERTPNSF